MTRTTRIMTGLLLVMVCLADIALTISAGDGSRASLAHALFQSKLWVSERPAGERSSSLGAPLRVGALRAPARTEPLSPLRVAEAPQQPERPRRKVHAAKPRSKARTRNPLQLAADTVTHDALLVGGVGAVRSASNLETPPAPAAAVDAPAAPVGDSGPTVTPAVAHVAPVPTAAGKLDRGPTRAEGDSAVVAALATPSPSADAPLLSEHAAASSETPEGKPEAETPPGSLGDYLTRGCRLIREGRSKEAIADFQRATVLDPASASARAGLAVAEAWSDDPDSAAVDLDKAVGLNPNEPLVYDGRAILAQKKGAMAEAIAAYGQALQLNPGDEFAREQQSVLQASLQHSNAALADTEARRLGVPEP